MNILKEGVRSAFLHIIRLCVYVIIFIVVAYIFGLISSSKAKALVKKDVINLTWYGSPYTFSITGNGTGAHVYWIDPDGYSNTNHYDYLAIIVMPQIKVVNNFEVDNVYWDGFSSGYSWHCTSYNNDGVCMDASISTRANSAATTLDGTVQTGTVVVHSVAYSEDGTKADCFFSNEYEGVLLCPFPNNQDIRKVTTYVTNYGYSQVSVVVEMSAMAYGFNNDSTDIAAAIGGVEQQQQQTNQTITDSNTNGSQSNGTTALNGIQSTMESKLKGTNELTQMVLSPITILTSISSSSCQPITWNIPLVNYQATIPCMSTVYNQYFSGILTLFSTIITGVFAYRTVIKLVSTLKDCLDAENDKIEVIDL